jgi:hypothetical protein
MEATLNLHLLFPQVVDMERLFILRHQLLQPLEVQAVVVVFLLQATEESQHREQLVRDLLAQPRLAVMSVVQAVVRAVQVRLGLVAVAPMSRLRELPQALPALP